MKGWTYEQTHCRRNELTFLSSFRLCDSDLDDQMHRIMDRNKKTGERLGVYMNRRTEPEVKGMTNRSKNGETPSSRCGPTGGRINEL